MTEKELIEEGFTRVDVPKTESGDTTDYYYYIYTFDNDWIIISFASDEVEGSSWRVHLDHVDGMEIRDGVELILFMNLVKKWLKSQKSG